MNPLTRARWIIVIVGILLPYLARVPGMLIHGRDWLTSYTETGMDGFLLISSFGAIAWGAILLATIGLKHAGPVWITAVFGFALPVLGHGTLDLSADAQAAVLLVFLPVFGIPGALIGRLIGQRYDRRLSGQP